MSLQSKILLVLVVSIFGLVGLDAVSHRWLMGRSLVDLERAQAEGDAERAAECLDELVRNLNGVSSLLATTLHTEHDFARLRDVDRNVVGVIAFDVLLVCAADGRVIEHVVHAPKANAELDLRDFPRGALLPTHPLMGSADVISGVMVTEHGPLVVSSRPLPDVNPLRGRLILGRFLTSEDVWIRAWDRGLQFEVWLLEDPALADSERILNLVASSTQPIVEVEDETIHVYAVLPDLRGFPVLLLKTTTQREVALQSLQSARWSLVSTTSSAILILFVIALMLRTIVTGPLRTLTRGATAIGETDGASVRLGMKRSDEIGLLSREFDRMLDQLDRSREDYAKTSRLAGMSELATGILHNLGNVVNGLTVSSALVLRHTDCLRTKQLSALVDALPGSREELERFVRIDPRGQHLVPLLAEINRSFQASQLSLRNEARSLDETVDHIVRLVQSQHGLTARYDLRVATDLAKLVDQAESICTQAGKPNESFGVVREYQKLPKLQIERQKLLDILVNLILNARYALESTERADRRLVLRLKQVGEDRVRIEVQDNGVGIPRENLPLIFGHGFTTRTGGNGFGLHVSANSAMEMGAVLAAHSDGPGQGATFSLEIPLSMPDEGPSAAQSPRRWGAWRRKKAALPT